TNKSGYQTYAGLYGGLPDPALNLPLRFQSRSAGSGELELWEPNRETSRKKMRGLFFRQAEIDPAANTYLQWAFNPKRGDIVRIEPRVYNYSTAVTAFNTVVEFQVIQYDSGRDSEICDAPINGAPTKRTGLVCPRSARTTIGKATISQLNPLQFTCISGYDDPAITGCARSVFLDWDTANFGPDFGTYDYRVYIVLNPGSRAGSEIYGLEPDPLNITNVENTTPMVVTAPGSDLETGDYVIIGDVQGLDKANGTFTITRISNDQFELNGSVSSRGSYAGGGMISMLDPGQNNEGYGTISITNIPAMTAGADPIPHDYLEANSLQGLSEDVSSRLVDSALTAVQGEPLELRFTAFSSMLHADGAHMLLFDGDPAEGNPAIADQVIHPGANGSDGTSIWFTWTPTTSGQHHLYAALIEEPEQQLPAAELDVNVVAPQHR
ncbi:MAG: ubiquitin-activating E1 FCCH domain-containing protein, partial [Candidatus Sulfotelmatobacter sp.]